MLGSGAVEPGIACDRAGTSEALNPCALAPCADWSFLSLPHAVPGLWNISGGLSTGGKALRWYARAAGYPGDGRGGAGKDLPGRVGFGARCAWPPVPALPGRGTGAPVAPGPPGCLPGALGGPRPTGPRPGRGGVDRVRSPPDLPGPGRAGPWDQPGSGSAERRPGIAFLSRLKADILGLPVEVPELTDCELRGTPPPCAVALGDCAAWRRPPRAWCAWSPRFEPDPATREELRPALRRIRRRHGGAHSDLGTAVRRIRGNRSRNVESDPADAVEWRLGPDGREIGGWMPQSVFQSIVLFILLAAGYAAGKLKVLGPESVRGLSRFIVDFSLPALIVISMQKPFSPELRDEAFRMLGISSAIYLIGPAPGDALDPPDPRPRARGGRSTSSPEPSPTWPSWASPSWGRSSARKSSLTSSIYNIPFQFLALSVGVILLTRGRGRSAPAIHPSVDQPRHPVHDPGFPVLPGFRQDFRAPVHGLVLLGDMTHPALHGSHRRHTVPDGREGRPGQPSGST
ncbi:MAG: hypothetical protein MZV70_35745 [Desulfobacterales bacterium]|nr:hypothetical protein [Desulfobacterales bacterium]